jgi:hypothetical protein
MVYLTSTGVAASTANIFVSTSNNVGIGTTSPGYALTLTGTPANASGRMLEVNTNMAGTAGTGECVSRMYFTDSGVTECGIRVGVKNISNPGNLSYPLQVYQNGTAVMSVTTSGNVGIGTTTPGYTLDVNGSMNVATVSSTTGLMFRNRIINGDMRIAQRGTSNVVVSATGCYFVDRFVNYFVISSGGATAYQNTLSVSDTGPYQQGFRYAANVVITSTLSANPIISAQVLEGWTAQDLNWGTTYGSPITVSYWFKSSATGTFGHGIRNPGFFTVAYTGFFTYSVAGVWQYISYTVPAPPTGYSWGTGTSASVELHIGGSFQNSAAAGWNAGSSFGNSTGVNWYSPGGYIAYTGVQFEKGSVATPFEFRPYATELALCQRYYEIVLDNFTNNFAYGMGYFPGGSATNLWFNFKVTKRATPTLANGTVASGGGSGGGTIGTIWYTPQYVSWAIAASGGGLFFYVLSNPPLSFSAEL